MIAILRSVRFGAWGGPRRCWNTCPRAFIACEAQAEGDEHVFRPRGDETACGPCGREAAWEAHSVKWEPRPLGDDYEKPAALPWRERIAALQAAGSAAG